MDELELDVLSDTMEALGSETTKGIGLNRLLAWKLCFTFPCPRVSSSIGVLSLTPNSYTDINGNPLIFLASGAAGHCGCNCETLS